MKDRHHRHFNFSRVNIIWPVIFCDDMSGAFLWTGSGTGADYNVDYLSNTPLVGSYSLRLYTRATGPAIGDFAQALKCLWATPYKRLNLQFAFVRYGTANSYYRALLTWYDGTNSHAAGLQFLYNEGTVQYINSGATWTTLTGVTYNTAGTFKWNYVSLTLDLTNNIYVQSTVQHQFTSMETIPFAVSPSANQPELDLIFYTECRAANRGGFCIDQILLRGDNP